VDPPVDADGLAEPWPGRVDAFLTACANHSAIHERSLVELMEGLSKGSKGSKD
jgi:hypothetical protein